MCCRCTCLGYREQVNVKWSKNWNSAPHSQHRNTSMLPELCIGDAKIKASNSAKDLGVVLDDTLLLKWHISNFCRAASFGVYRIGRIRKYLDPGRAERLVHAFVTSRLNCNNSLLYGLPASQLARLQLVQNAAARLVTQTKRCDHISPILYEVHWLRIEDRVALKILLTAYNVHHGIAPKYICHLLSDYLPERNLRSASQLLFKPGPRTKTRYGDRASAVAAPRLWNHLPLNIHRATTMLSFMRKLKTHLFKYAWDFLAWTYELFLTLLYCCFGNYLHISFLYVLCGRRGNLLFIWCSVRLRCWVILSASAWYFFNPVFFTLLYI